MQHKIKFFAKIYNKNLGTNLSDDKFSIKWDRELTGYAAKNIEKSFENEKIVIANYRPFFKQYFYYDKHFNGMTYQFPNIIPFGRQNKSLSLCISGIGFSKSFQALAINSVPSLDILEKTQCLPLYAYDKNGAKQDNITDWALQ